MASNALCKVVSSYRRHPSAQISDFLLYLGRDQGHNVEYIFSTTHMDPRGSSIIMHTEHDRYIRMYNCTSTVCVAQDSRPSQC